MTLIGATRATFRRVHDSPRTEEAYLHWIRELVRFHQGRHPRGLEAAELTAFLDHLAVERLEPPFRLIGELLHASGLRLLECMRRRGKGEVDGPALLPLRLREGLSAQLAEVERRHELELAQRRGEVDLPQALRAKMPSAATSLAWQYLFPASRPCTDPATGRPVLHHLHASAVQKAVVRAAGTDIRTIQTLLGHKDVRTTMTHTHIVDRGPLGVVSPLDR